MERRDLTGNSTPPLMINPDIVRHNNRSQTSRFLRPLIALFSALPLCGAAPNVVASDLETPLLQMSLEQLLNVEVTGSTNDRQNLANVPAAVSVFTHHDIQALGVDSLDQLVNFAPGYQSNKNGGNSNYSPYSSRSRRISGASSEILVLVDGQRIDDPRTSGAANILSRLPLANIERVEFIRGPGSALYGSNAMQGVINIVTRTGVNAVNVEMGSFDHKALRASGSTEYEALQIDAFFQYQEDQGDQFTVPNPNAPSEMVDTQDPRKNLHVNLKLKYNDTSLDVLHYQYTTKDFYQNGSIANGVNSRDAELSSARFSHTKHWQNISSNLVASYHTARSQAFLQLLPAGSLIDISTPPSNEPFVGGNNAIFYSEQQLRWTNHWRLHAKHRLQFGTEYRHIDAPELKVTTNYSVVDFINNQFPIRYYGGQEPGRSAQEASTRDIFGLYVQHQYTPLNNLEFTFGVRADKFSNIGQRMSPRIAAVYHPSEFHTFKLLYSEAFRAPSEAELNLTSNPQFLGNPDLEPEFVKTTEAIWMANWEKGSMSVGVFEHRLFNAIVQEAIENSAQMNFNIDQSPVRGAEVELAYQPVESLFIRATHTAVFNKPEASYREASHMSSLIVNYQHAKLSASTGIYWHGKKEMSTQGNEDSRIELDPIVGTYGKLCWSFNDQWSGYLKANNLLDEAIYTPAQTSNLTEGIPNRGRNIQLGITLSY